MDIVVTGRHTQISDRFRAYLDDKLAKVAQIAPKVTRVDVVVTHERTPRNSEFVELTCRDRGSVVRAEASSDDKYNALDQAIEKLLERLRRASGRRRAAVRAPRPELAAISVREKVHSSEPMSLAEAVNQMELVGHDFYLFNDADTGKASVVYRRRGWSYGVIHLEPAPGH